VRIRVFAAYSCKSRLSSLLAAAAPASMLRAYKCIRDLIAAGPFTGIADD